MSIAHMQDQALRASREGRSFIITAMGLDTLSAGVVQTAAGAFKAIPVGSAAVLKGFMIHLHTLDDQLSMEIGYTANADGTGAFTRVSPELHTENGDKKTGAVPAFVTMPVPMYLKYSATCKAVAVKLTANDDAAEAGFAVAGWIEDESTLS